MRIRETEAYSKLSLAWPFFRRYQKNTENLSQTRSGESPVSRVSHVDLAQHQFCLELRWLCLKGAAHTFVEKEIIFNTSSRERVASISQNKFKTLVKPLWRWYKGSCGARGPDETRSLSSCQCDGIKMRRYVYAGAPGLSRKWHLTRRKAVLKAHRMVEEWREQRSIWELREITYVWPLDLSLHVCSK